jgi:very-short-patch-repair endonuclease
VGRPNVTVEGRRMAAVLAGGDGAVLSHRSAAAHWGILRTARSAIEVTVPRRLRSRTGLEFHWARLPADEITVHDGIPITTVPRTIFDLAAVERPSRVDAAFNEAEVRQLTDPLSLSDLLLRYPGARGARSIRAMLATGPQGISREELEHRFRDFIDDYDIPRPRFNRDTPVGSRLVEGDCVWPEQRLIVELDGRATHGTRRAFEEDRAKDRALTIRGWRVIRVTWRQLHDDPEGLAGDLRALLRAAA